MASFFGKLRSSAGPLSPSTGASPSKKDATGAQPTPLDKLLESAGPLRNDGSDKFFGMENFGNTCYCNSILQCLYYSVPFREQVMQYPVRSPPDSLKRRSGSRRPNGNGTTIGGGPNLAAATSRPSGTTSSSPLARRMPPVVASPAQAGGRPEDKADSPEYKKKHAMLAGPVLSMDYDNAPTYDMPESLFTSLKDIFEAIVAHESRSGVVSPQRFLEGLKRENEMFRTSMHQDAHEFLNLLLNEVVANVEANRQKMEENKALANGSGHPQSLASVMASTVAPPAFSKASRNTDWVHDLFEGTLTSETKCLTCENVSQRDEAFLDLSVDLDQHSSVTSCLRKFSEEEMLCERNKFHCDRCGGLQEAEKRMKIKRLPRILALHLKRFKYTEDLQRLQKLFHRVVYPYHLRLFNTTDDAEDPDRLYELYAVVVHIGGGPYHGHYVSIIKTEGRGWLLFDDEMVEPVDKSYVRNFFGDKPGLACAYVLFYQETTVEAVQKEQAAEELARARAAQRAKEGGESKSNGNVMDGLLHPVQTHHVQAPSETEAILGLDHSAFEPARPQTKASPQTAEPEQGPPSPLTPRLDSKKGDVKSKKEKAEEEKKQKQAEKEREKADRQRARSTELKRKDQDKRQKEEIKAALAASKHSKADEDTRGDHEHVDGKHESTNGHGTGNGNSNGAGTGNGNANAGGVISGSLNRFRQGSKSIGRRPKFWTTKGKEDGPRKSGELLGDAPNAGPKADSHAHDAGPAAQGRAPDADEKVTAPVPSPDKHDKAKGNRFSLKRKTSSMFT
ncbi:MAG: hypothetical protein M1832_001781 [Thelocarpon impressellum]|nr:MAG: hypothetical protein M1832_001781 [Thelocarpon impressellum]